MCCGVPTPLFARSYFPSYLNPTILLCSDSAYIFHISQVPALLLDFLSLKVVVSTVGNGTANKDDSVETDAEASGAGVGVGGGGCGSAVSLGLGVAGLEVVWLVGCFKIWRAYRYRFK